mmetsp:Transcript_11175/g.15684  ORF Transcript_11175/g.15684 Transcript_11175/m.15684 type:complete len:203 (-) Transcript_11175:191-799(-)
MPKLILVLLRSEDLEMNIPSRLGGELVCDGGEVAGHYREEVRRLGEGVRPHRKVPASLELPSIGAVAVAQQDWAGLLIGFEAHGGELGHDVRAVQEVGEAPEAFGFHLRAVHAPTVVQAGELGILLRLNLHLDLQPKAFGVTSSIPSSTLSFESLACHGHLLPVHCVTIAFFQRRAVHGHALQLQVLAVQGQLLSRRALAGL